MPSLSDITIAPGKSRLFGRDGARVIALDKLDTKVLSSYTDYIPNVNTKHILEFEHLFTNSITTYFRALNHTSMFDSYRAAGSSQRVLHFMHGFVLPTLAAYVGRRLPAANNKCLVLELRREHMLEDAFDQLRGRERRELPRPLKIKMKGEDGVDQGGVAQEFFRLAFKDVFDEDFGGSNNSIRWSCTC
jgi:hypothetical protein